MVSRSASCAAVSQSSPSPRLSGRQARKRWRSWVDQPAQGMAEAGPLSAKKARAAASTGTKASDTGGTQFDGMPGW